ncbi:MAG: thiamine phosphate synthase [Crocinitomicaceae bacterium]|nr:thiamine phosphate synthase [Crocinitomicaceae bacterium]
MISKLQYITTGSDAQTHIEKCRSFCEQAGDWVQLRMKNVSDEVYLNTALECRRITEEYGAKLIINDNIQVAKNSNADGVHLGLNDESAYVAREVLGRKIIGGTANTIEDVILQVNAGVDYVGLGPFRFTNTKKKLSPILGLEGYKRILDKLKAEGINTPVVGIGGIDTEDINPLLDTGLFGIAASGMIDRLIQENRLKDITKNLVYEQA